RRRHGLEVDVRDARARVGKHVARGAQRDGEQQRQRDEVAQVLADRGPHRPYSFLYFDATLALSPYCLTPSACIGILSSLLASARPSAERFSLYFAAMSPFLSPL